MKKKMMILDFEPRTCEDDCPLAKWNEKENAYECQLDGEMRTFEEAFSLIACPLRDVPSYINNIVVKAENKEINDKNKGAYINGWNDCVDYLLKSKKRRLF